MHNIQSNEEGICIEIFLAKHAIRKSSVDPPHSELRIQAVKRPIGTSIARSITIKKRFTLIIFA